MSCEQEQPQVIAQPFEDSSTMTRVVIHHPPSKDSPSYTMIQMEVMDDATVGALKESISELYPRLEEEHGFDMDNLVLCCQGLALDDTDLVSQGYAVHPDTQQVFLHFRHDDPEVLQRAAQYMNKRVRFIPLDEVTIKS